MLFRKVRLSTEATFAIFGGRNLFSSALFVRDMTVQENCCGNSFELSQLFDFDDKSKNTVARPHEYMA